MKKKILIIFIFICSLLSAADISINIQASKESIAVGEQFEMSVSAEGNLDRNIINDIQLKGIENFKVINSQSSFYSSTNISIGFGNNKSSSKESVNLKLDVVGIKKGKFTITGLIKGKSFTSNTISINVQDAPQNLDDKMSQSNGKDIFVSNSKLPQQIYFGEKVPLLYDLYIAEDFYTSNQLGNPEGLKNPELSGFIIKDLPKENNIFYMENNRRFQKYNLKQSVLQAVKSGKIIIPSFGFNIPYVTNEGEMIRKYVSTNETKINVLSLPEPKPEGFKNIVGIPVIESSNSSASINFGESVTANIKISGECNLDTVEEIYPESIDGVKIYQTVKEKKEIIQNGKYYAEKEFEVVFIPEKSGKIVIPEVKIPYFNLEKKVYEKVVLKSFEINVSGSVIDTKNNSLNLNKTKKRDNEVQNRNNISLIEEEGPKLKDGIRIIKYILIILTSLLILIGLIYLILGLKKYLMKRESFEKLLELNFGVNMKVNSKEEISKKICDKEICDKVLVIIEEVEKEKFGFNGNREKIEEYSKKVTDILKKRKKKGN